ncbi:hypothetical protein [Herbiconiux liukaitaii]|uniref:hypothetical protein n=1 Tax=Herbiconiux liukaitaii TaxID=3342799 RepID=UPI0035B9A833
MHRRWPKLVGIVLIVVVNFVVWGTWVGRCDDYAPAVSARSTCVTEPAVGLPGAILIAFVSVVAIIALVRGLVSTRQDGLTASR